MENQKKTSETAVVTASLRALGCYEDDEKIRCRDHLAELFLPEEKREQLKSEAFRAGIRTAIPEGLYEYVLARTRYFDDLFEASLQDGIRQIVILGAGYDSRPYRFENLIQDTLIFEVDALATQKQKRKILMDNGISSNKNIRYIAMDFEQDSLTDMLLASGFDPSYPAFFLWEGVTFYLRPDTVETMLRSLRSLAVIHSVLCFDFQTVDQRNGLIDTGLENEKIRFGIESGKWNEYLAGMGYAVAEHVGSKEMRIRYLTRSDGSFFGGVSPIMNLVKAVMV